MPGLYLLIILVSGTCNALIDRRWRLAAWSAPGRTAATVAIGVAFFLAWDAVGIVTGVFLKGGSGVWGAIPMPPQTIGDDDARAVARWLAESAGP